MSRARELSSHVEVNAQRSGDRTGTYEALAALREALVGNLALARRQAEEVLKITDSKYVEAAAAVVLGLTGDSARATRIADDLDRRFPQATSLQFHYLPMIRGAAAMAGRNGGKAMEAFAAGAPYEVGTPEQLANLLLYPVYLHGVSCLAAGQSAQAVVEFQKILDHPGLTLSKLVGPLAHLGLGRAYAMAGDSAKAKIAYQDFLALWKDADPDVPILKQAKAEYAKLS